MIALSEIDDFSLLQSKRDLVKSNFFPNRCVQLSTPRSHAWWVETIRRGNALMQELARASRTRYLLSDQKLASFAKRANACASDAIRAAYDLGYWPAKRTQH
ncbi:hypothetical protein I6F33_32510 [Bradyrhizobium sp. BRP20]|uniref:hypothetical protein n=1 Tax=Bradyrhizobium sp. BRP20 TaxID=2793822 RepID=UPI001CD78435|nr:hypothetical protein [Bradyrhizobium sp. BRP20]MCA1437651.1 hypothetical protein [Bradyrhizobium sp. BRP20]